MAGTRDRGDSDRIKRPSNSFFLFRSEYWHRWKAAQTSLNKPVRQSEFSRVVKEAWKSADQAEYKRRADQLKAEHARKYPDYKFQPRRKRKLAADDVRRSPDPQRRRGKKSPVATSSSSRVALNERSSSKKKTPRPRTTIQPDLTADITVNNLPSSTHTPTVIKVPTVANVFPAVARSISRTRPALLPPSPGGLQDPPRLSRPSTVARGATTALTASDFFGAGNSQSVTQPQRFRNSHNNRQSSRTQSAVASASREFPPLPAETAIGERQGLYHREPQEYHGALATQFSTSPELVSNAPPSTVIANWPQTYQDSSNNQENFPPVAPSSSFQWPPVDQPELYVPVPLQEVQDTSQVSFDWYTGFTDQWQYSLAAPGPYHNAYYQADVGASAPYAAIEEFEG
ncbi:hypothetical protein BV20DRAFT_1055359 [Pilatotrama ljubarskyi]|nr:hypothetical protein BV20DRAFT_1055359 [Pilatotrama ljubarskyi]